MSRKRNSDDRIQGRWVPLRHEVLNSPAWKHTSFGARLLYIALLMRFVKNNGHVYLSQRDAGEALGHANRNDIADWYRELRHYGFVVQTEAASLGVDGKGKAPHWRITELPIRKSFAEFADPTKNFLRWDGVVFEPHVPPSRRWSARKQAAIEKQNPGLHVGTTVDCTSVPVLDYTSVPPNGRSGTNVQSISAHPSGTNVQSISRLFKVAG